jgi:glycosyltransferase involved in cell wall biosynthesis
MLRQPRGPTTLQSATERDDRVRIVFDAFAVRTGTTAIVLENLLTGWSELAANDKLIVLASSSSEFSPPPGVEVKLLEPPTGGFLGSLWLRSYGVRRGCRDVDADALVSLVTASSLLGAPCPRAAIVYDLRHELRPHQFSRRRRLARRLSYAWTFRTADVLCCISERTLDDLLRKRPRLRRKAVATRLGADHAEGWPAPAEEREPYALAFGHFANKNADAVIEAWAEFCHDNHEVSLRLVGMSKADREAAARRVAELGLGERVTLMPWLRDDEFAACFVGASLIVFPSDFEGFGLPAVEAMQLGLPLVISRDPALAEVTGGHCVTAADLSPATLAHAMREALESTQEDRDDARRHAAQFQWQFMAADVRAALLDDGGPTRTSPLPSVGRG